jgi:YHS domain-containing protein
MTARRFSILAALCLAGCTQTATPPTAAAPADTAQTAAKKSHAECLVCKHENDLACLDVAVDKTTPTVEYNGRTYYFCSDGCAKDFKKDPAKFTAAAGK